MERKADEEEEEEEVEKVLIWAAVVFSGAQH